MDLRFFCVIHYQPIIDIKTFIYTRVDGKIIVARTYAFVDRETRQLAAIFVTFYRVNVRKPLVFIQNLLLVINLNGAMVYLFISFKADSNIYHQMYS